MANLPINVSTAPAQVSSPSAGSADAAPQDGQGFGDVLARQVADSSTTAAPPEKPADPAAKDGAVAPAMTDKSVSMLPDVANTLPADMLAALFMQQNPNATPAATALPQSVVNGQLQVGLPVAPMATLSTTASSKETGAPVTAFAANTTLPQAAASTSLDSVRSAGPAVSQGKPSFTDTLKAMGKNEIPSPQSADLPLKLSIAELTAAAQQPAVNAAALAGSTPVMMAASALSSQLTVSTPVNQAGWSNDFSQKVTWLATQRDQSAELHLNPPQLGPLDVVLKVSGDQATALFTSPHAAVRDAIELALPKLREMLADNGIMLGNATVSDQASRKDQDNLSRSQQGSGNASDRNAEGTASGQQGGRIATISRHNGLVDTFA